MQGGVEGNTDPRSLNVTVDSRPSLTVEPNELGPRSAVNNDQLNLQVEFEFQRARTEFEGLGVDCRPRIPTLGWSGKLNQVVKILNDVQLPKFLENNKTFIKIHEAVYLGAAVAARLCGKKLISPDNTDKSPVISKPAWLRRLERKVDTLRGDINRLIRYTKGQRGRRLVSSVSKIMRKAKIHGRNDEFNCKLKEYIDTLKQQLAVIVKRIRRYKKSQKRRMDNNQFRKSERLFYKSLKLDPIPTPKDVPDMQQIVDFWTRIWSPQKPGTSFEGTPWMNLERQAMNRVEEMDFHGISKKDIQVVLKRTPNWRAPGIDGIQGFWWKRFTCTHETLATQFLQFIMNPECLPQFMTEGVTYMKPKGKDTSNPATFRPITCLNVIYKVLTGCIKDKIEAHCENNEILAVNQRGCSRGAKGCRELLTIDSVATQQAKRQKCTLHCAYIDVQKAYDSLTHEWLIGCLELYKVNTNIRQFLGHIITHWNTRLSVQTKGGVKTSPVMKVQRGIFQGDSLSPLWFCIALNPLSRVLDSTSYGFKIRSMQSPNTSKLTHLIYMDDLKLFASTKTHLHNLIRLTEDFMSSIGLKFNPEKCRTHAILKGVEAAECCPLSDGQVMESLATGATYRYLGMEQNRGVDHTKVRKDLETEFVKRLQEISSSGLTSVRLTRAVNSYAVPVLTYSFGIVKWTKTHLENLQRTMRMTLNKYRKRHVRSSIERMILPRREGGQGFADLAVLYRDAVEELRRYFLSRRDSSNLHRVIIEADIGITPLNLEGELQLISTEARRADLIRAWRQKRLHGRYAAELANPEVDKELSVSWLVRGDLYPETEAFLLAIQDQVVHTRNYARFIIGDTSVDDTCRRCGTTTESIQHIVAGCTVLAANAYKRRHDVMGGIVHQALAAKLGLIETEDPYYRYSPEAVLDSAEHRLYWDRTVLTDVQVQHNRPDVVWLDKKKRNVILVDFAVPLSANLQTTFVEKIVKYEALAQEIKSLWEVQKVEIIPIIISATGVIPRTLTQGLDRMGLPTKIIEAMQKAVLLSTARIVRSSTNEK